MACISKLANAIAYDCDSGATGVVSAVIINKADIASFSVNPGSGAVPTLVLAKGASAYKIDAVKRSIVASSALKVNDGAPNAYTHTVNLTITDGNALNRRVFTNNFSNGTYVVLVKQAGVTGGADVYGLYYGLNATTVDKSTHDNGGWITVTLETPETVIGEDNLALSEAAWEAIYAAAVG